MRTRGLRLRASDMLPKVERHDDPATNTRYYFVRITKRLHPRVLAPNGTKSGTQSTHDMVRERGFAAAMNSGLFHPVTQIPEGIIIENGKVVQNRQTTFYPGCMPLTISRDGSLGSSKPDADAYDLAADGIESAVCGFMPVIVDHEPVRRKLWPSVPHFENPHQRQVIGQFEDGDYAIISCEGRGYAESTGWKIADVQRICMLHGLKFAYNLDGGTSTETVIDGVQLNAFYKNETGRLVPTFIVFEEIGEAKND